MPTQQVSRWPRPFLQPPQGISRHRFVVLFFTLLVFLLLVPIVHQLRQALHSATPPLLEGLALVAVLAGTVMSVSTSPARAFVALGLGLPGALLVVVRGFFDSALVAILHHVVGVVFFSCAITMMFVFIFTNRRVTFDTVCASLCIYLLLGVVWSLGYAVLELLDPAAFQATVPGESPPILRIGKGESTAALYFSFATLTTLGYGDIVPVSPMARMLACVEAITGQLYLAVLVARLVGLHLAESIAPQTKPPELGAAQARAEESSQLR